MNPYPRGTVKLYAAVEDYLDGEKAGAKQKAICGWGIGSKLRFEGRTAY